MIGAVLVGCTARGH